MLGTPRIRATDTTESNRQSQLGIQRTHTARARATDNRQLWVGLQTLQTATDTTRATYNPGSNIHHRQLELGLQTIDSYR